MGFLRGLDLMLYVHFFVALSTASLAAPPHLIPFCQPQKIFENRLFRLNAVTRYSYPHPPLPWAGCTTQV